MKAKRNLAKKSKSLNVPTVTMSKSKVQHSKLLQSDARVQKAFRFTEILAKNGADTYFLRIYPGIDPDVAASELVTIVKVPNNGGTEVEMRFDEMFPTPLAFRRSDDAKKVQAAKEQIERGGGVAGIAARLKS